MKNGMQNKNGMRVVIEGMREQSRTQVSVTGFFYGKSVNIT